MSEEHSGVSRISEEEYLSDTLDDLFSDKTAQKYASGSDAENDYKDDYEDKNIGCEDSASDVVMYFDRRAEGGEKDQIHSQAIYNMIQLIPSSSIINFKFQHEEHP